jgi:hypothetical protein
MRYSTVLMVTMLVILLTVAAGCTSAPKAGALITTTETTTQPASVVTTAVPASTPAVTVTTGTKCPSGQVTCADGTCRDTTSDHDACGGCGNVCPAGYICKASSCINPAGPTAAATQVTTSPNNPVTTTVPTPVIAQSLVRRSSLSDLQFATVTATTYPPNTQNIDCSKYPITITSVSPASGPKSGGTPVVIHGSGFISGAFTDVEVRFGNTYNSVTPNSNTEIVLTSPSRTTAGYTEVQVLARFGPYANACLNPVTNASHFTYT